MSVFLNPVVPKIKNHHFENDINPQAPYCLFVSHYTVQVKCRSQHQQKALHCSKSTIQELRIFLSLNNYSLLIHCSTHTRDSGEKRKSSCHGSREEEELLGEPGCRLQAGVEWSFFIYFLNFCLVDTGTSGTVKTAGKSQQQTSKKQNSYFSKKRRAFLGVATKEYDWCEVGVRDIAQK